MSEIDQYKEAMQKARSDLIDDLSQRELIIFAGAGISEPTGIPLWKELLKALNETQPLDGVTIDDVKEYQYPNIAQMLFDEFTKNDNAEYINIIQAKMQSTKIPHTTTQEEMILASNGRIITTNFDDTFESAFDSLKRHNLLKHECTTQVLPALEKEKATKPNNITYLHGKADDCEIIFKNDDYKKYYSRLSTDQESSLEKLLKHLFIDSGLTIVFVGFSFSDDYIMRTLERIYWEAEMDLSTILLNVRHYAILESSDSTSEEHSRIESLQKDLNAINISSMMYNNQMHKEIYELFVNISQIRNQRSEDKQDLIEPKDQANEI